MGFGNLKSGVRHPGTDTCRHSGFCAAKGAGPRRVSLMRREPQQVSASVSIEDDQVLGTMPLLTASERA